MGWTNRCESITYLCASRRTTKKIPDCGRASHFSRPLHTRAWRRSNGRGAAVTSGRSHIPWIMPVIFSHLGCFVISYTPLIDTINKYFHDYKICMHCTHTYIYIYIYIYILNLEKLAAFISARGGRYDQNSISQYDKFYITITIYITIWWFFYFKKVIILKSLIPYDFHNPCHQCHYQTNTSLKRERKNNSTSLKINKRSVMKDKKLIAIGQKLQ